jgi:hypothetical protein
MAELGINLTIVQRGGKLIEEASKAVFKDGELRFGSSDLIKHLLKGKTLGGFGRRHG